MNAPTQIWHDFYEQHHRITVAWLCAAVQRLWPTLDYRSTHDHAEDAVQAAWLALLSRGLRPGDRMPGLLMTMARRGLYEVARKEHVAVGNARHLMHDGASTLADGAIATTQIRDVAAVLTEARLEAWVLRHVRGMAYKDIAEVMHLASAHAAGAILAKAHHMLEGA